MHSNMAKKDLKKVELELRRYEREDRIKDKDLFEVVEEVFDRRTVLSVIELKRRGCLKTLKGVVSAGKEARVYWAIAPDGSDLAVKIYLTVTAEFRKSIWKYIKGDPRFEWIDKLPRRKLMAVWARKEYSNLKRLHRAGVLVPQPICYHDTIIVMKFIGERGKRAPLLKELLDAGELDTELAKYLLNRILEFVKIAYVKAKLIHADLSEYNVMVWQGEPYLIDVAQAVRIDHPNALEFLRRDIHNIIRFFDEEVGIDVPDPDEILKEIVKEGSSGYPIGESEVEDLEHEP